MARRADNEFSVKTAGLGQLNRSLNRISIPEGAVAIQLGGYKRNTEIRGWALVDEDDYDWLSRWKWSLVGGYAARLNPANTRMIRMHRLLLGLKDGDGRHTDHLNRCRTDNRRANLRVVTHAQNMQNLPPRKNAESRFRGVAKDRGRWRAYMQVDKKSVSLGAFGTEEEAAQAAAAGRREQMPFAVD